MRKGGRVRIFQDIPVYRLPETSYKDAMEEFISKHTAGNPSDPIQMMYARNLDSKLYYESHLRKVYGGPWEYNEIVGFIRLHFLGFQIRGDYWAHQAKRVVKTRRKLFGPTHSKVGAEVSIPIDANSAEVYTLILKYLDRCKTKLKRRYIDTSRLEEIGPYVDWSALLAAHNNLRHADARGAGA
jgi:hypothetical protein|tara:strand:+ start:1350 stop:1901 length:552 start_codon:yes stop_codon:yes gene_type:complete